MTDRPERELKHYEKRLLERVQKAGYLIHEHDEEKGDRYLLPTGKEVGPASARGLIALGKLKPRHDGLFGGCSQTFEP